MGQTLTVSYVFMLPQQNENSHHERTTVNQAYQYYNVADPQEPPTGASPQHSAGREKWKNKKIIETSKKHEKYQTQENTCNNSNRFIR